LLARMTCVPDNESVLTITASVVSVDPVETATVPAPVIEATWELMKKVTVQLSCVSEGVPRTRSISTYASQNGIQNYIMSTNSN